MKYALVLVPFHSMSSKELKKYAFENPQIEFCFSDTATLEILVREKINDSTQIIAARANSAKLIKKWYPTIQVIEIPLTSYDILHSIEKVKIFGKSIGLVTTNNFLVEQELFEKIFQVKILNYSLTPIENFSLVIKKAIEEGADVILGGALAQKAAEKLGIKAITLQMGMESMNRTLNEIKSIKETIDFESRSQRFLSLLMDNVLEGIISLDSENKINSINEIAEKILGIKEKLLIGQEIKKVFNYFNIPKTIALYRDVNNVLNVNGNELIVRRVPIVDDEKYIGTIITMHETKNIQNLENVIRQQKYERIKVAKYSFENLIGESKAIKHAINLARDYAKTEFNILIIGETGTGKELFAQSLHNESSRKDKPFITVNCAAIPPTLLESELFGYVEGAFTGASKKGKMGLFQLAHEGTIFLDEISEMNFQSQGALLRVIQEKYMTRLGSNDIIPIDVRIIAATNKNLKKLVEENKFRNDLYYRLNVLNLALPSIKDRKRDIILFLEFFLKTESDISNNILNFTKDAQKFLEEYSWPGNVREIRNIAQRILATAQDPLITKEFLEGIMHVHFVSNLENIEELTENEEKHLSVRERIQKEEIKEALVKFKGNTKETAYFLKISKTTLWRRMKKFNIN